MYWCCAQVEPRRERLASYCLGLAGYEIYQPLLREQRRSRSGRKITVTPPLFPGYLFLLGGLRLVEREVVARRGASDHGRARSGARSGCHYQEIRSRERGGYVELLKPRGFRPGMRVRVIDGPLREQIGMLAALRPHERVLVLLQLLGGQQRVELARNAVEVVQQS